MTDGKLHSGTPTRRVLVFVVVVPICRKHKLENVGKSVFVVSRQVSEFFRLKRTPTAFRENAANSKEAKEWLTSTLPSIPIALTPRRSWRGAVVLGDVTVGARSGIWFNAVVRGDTEAVRIGSETNIQDACVLHADPGLPCILGDRVTVGHAAIVHGARIDDEVMIGMRAVILNGCRTSARAVS